MDKEEFKQAVKEMGYDTIAADDAKVTQIMKDVDKNNSGVIEWAEFLDMMISVTKQELAPSDSFTEKMEGIKEECGTYIRCVNKELADIEEIKERLPIDKDAPQDLFSAFYDGILGMYLLNKIDEDEEIIDMRTVNHGTNMNVFKVRQNLNQFLAGC